MFMKKMLGKVNHDENKSRFKLNNWKLKSLIEERREIKCTKCHQMMDGRQSNRTGNQIEA